LSICLIRAVDRAFFAESFGIGVYVVSKVPLGMSLEEFFPSLVEQCLADFRRHGGYPGVEVPPLLSLGPLARHLPLVRLVFRLVGRFDLSRLAGWEKVQGRLFALLQNGNVELRTCLENLPKLTSQPSTPWNGPTPKSPDVPRTATIPKGASSSPIPLRISSATRFSSTGCGGVVGPGRAPAAISLRRP